MSAGKYGDDHVAQIVTFGTMAARGVIRDVGRVLNMPYAEVDAIAKHGAQHPAHHAGRTRCGFPSSSATSMSADANVPPAD